MSLIHFLNMPMFHPSFLSFCPPSPSPPPFIHYFPPPLSLSSLHILPSFCSFLSPTFLNFSSCCFILFSCIPCLNTAHFSINPSCKNSNHILPKFIPLEIALDRHIWQTWKIREVDIGWHCFFQIRNNFNFKIKIFIAFPPSLTSL